MITDADSGDPLIGANVLVVGTTSGTVTDIDGSYSLSVPDGGTVIEISYTGYSSQRITLGASNK
jgi:iron complex outermembrane receptor protein